VIRLPRIRFPRFPKYKPRPRRNVQALALTAAMSIVITGLAIQINSDCHELVVWTSREKFALLTSVAASYPAPAVDRRCVTVKIVERSSGTAERLLAKASGNEPDRPDVWSPAATTWLSLLEHHRAGREQITPEVANSLIQSPLVIAMLDDMAQLLKRSHPRIGWHELLELEQDPRGWARLGGPWGKFVLGKTTPLISTSGLHALISLNNAAQAETSALEFLEGIEANVPHYADSVNTFLVNLRRADERGQALQYVSAIAVEEKQVYDYNRGNTTSEYCPACTYTPPQVKLVPIYPREGTIVANHPYAILNWTDAAHRQAALDFERYLQSDPVQQRFTDQGFRNHRGRAGDVLRRAGFDPLEPRSLDSTDLNPQAIDDVIRFWTAEVRKKANALFVIDVAAPTDGAASDDRLVKLKAALRTEIAEQLTNSDALGIWTVPSGDDRPYRERCSIRELGPQPRTGFERCVDEIGPADATRAIHRTIRDAMTTVRATAAPTRVNAVIVISDGIATTTDSIGELLIWLRQQPQEGRVLLITIALSAEMKTRFDGLASEFGGLSYDAIDPSRLGDMIRSAVANL
jgi:Ca-activated chloride channel family protein